MPLNVGSQEISLKFLAPRNSSEVNRRFLNTRPTGIYSGGVLSIIDNSNANLSPVVCEIGDGDHQVRVETTVDVSVAVSSATSYIVLRWAYTGGADDYMEILAVNSGNVQATDVVVGRCTFTGGGALNGFTYSDTTHPRSFPNVQNLWLKVIPVDSSMTLRILPGMFQSHTGSILVPFQQTSAIVPPASNSRIYLVYVDSSGTVLIDSSGTSSVSPVAPSYAGRLVLAEVTVSSTDTSISESQIKDVRPFITHGRQSTDGTTITTNTSGQLKTVDKSYLSTRTVGNRHTGVSAWTKVDDLGTTIASVGSDIVRGTGANSGIITLAANKLYAISYQMVFERATSSPEVDARIRVLSGDVSWWFTDSENNQSWLKAELPDIVEAYGTLSGTWFIKPSVTTTFQLEVRTEDANGHTASLHSNTMSIWTI